MPHALVLELSSDQKQKIASQSLSSKHIHGLFYHLLSEVSPAMSTAVHAAKDVPFTLAGKTHKEQPGAVSLRISLLDDELFRPLLELIHQQSASGIVLGNSPYTIGQILATPEGHPRAGFCTWDEILAAPAQQKMMLNFLTPTVFSTTRQNGRRHFTPLPEPRLILRSLLRNYQAFCPTPYPQEEAIPLRDILTEQFVVTQLRIQTQSYSAGNHKYTGFVGQVGLAYLDSQEHVRKLLGRLQKLAFYCGVGAKASYGMGQVALSYGR